MKRGKTFAREKIVNFSCSPKYGIQKYLINDFWEKKKATFPPWLDFYFQKHLPLAEQHHQNSSLWDRTTLLVEEYLIDSHSSGFYLCLMIVKTIEKALFFSRLRFFPIILRSYRNANNNWDDNYYRSSWYFFFIIVLQLFLVAIFVSFMALRKKSRSSLIFNL